MQRNIFQNIVSGSWNVEVRFEGDNRWISIYCGGSETEARAAYRFMSNPSE